MKCLAIQASPNRDGLTANVAEKVLEGFRAQGGETELIHLNHTNIKPCIACVGIAGNKNHARHQDDDFDQGGECMHD